ncbi:MAG: hypothetical protein NXH73_05080 [Flavobacteriaceae bacterium]|nr:hypothetical protein [Flavobacteriaceae bacterium]
MSKFIVGLQLRKMDDSLKLTLIKILHTLIWVFFNMVIFYLLYAVLVNKIDLWVWICLGLIVLEGLILLIFKAVCPITLVARKYSDSQKHNFDIYLPNRLAKYNKHIYTTIVLIAVVILIYRLLTNP